MRIAITADLHLTARKAHPERFAAMEDVLKQCAQLKLDGLIIAGDLFDRTQHNFSEFEKAYAKAHPEGLPVTVIPGNHDSELTPGSLAAEGLEVLAEPTLRKLEDGSAVLFVPYRAGSAMGEHLPDFADQLDGLRWALVSHGDWAAGRRVIDPNEPGTYMPLTRSDLDAYRPAAALLGHVHAPTDDPPVHYAGSPCPLDINETGLRRFLIYDSATAEVSSQTVDSPRLYFNETLVMLPVDDEAAYLKRELQQRVERWGVPDAMRDRIQVRLRIVGYAADRKAVEAAARDAMDGLAFYEEGPDLSQLNQAVDLDRIQIARQVREWIGGLGWPVDGPEPSAEDIALEALRVIWGD